MVTWLARNRLEVVAFLVIIIGASYCRYYQLPDYMIFLGDQGRDALIVKRMLVDHEMPLLGPSTSVGDVRLGPIFYYMMAVPMLISWLNPAAATALIATLGVASVILVYLLARKWFGVLPAILAASLYAISPVNIVQSRTSWNPNPLPFFALLAMYGFSRAHESRDFRWLLLTGVGLGLATQMHYLAFILLLVFGLLWAGEFIGIKSGQQSRFFGGGSLLAVIGFLVLMTPLALYDLQNNYANSRAALAVLNGGSESSFSLDIRDAVLRLASTYVEKLVGRHMTAQNNWLALMIAGLLVVGPLVAVRVGSAINNRRWPYVALSVWLALSMGILAFYKWHVYDHYLEFVNPVPFLLLGGTVALLKSKWRIGIAIGLIVVLGLLNLWINPLRGSPNYTLIRSEAVARYVVDEAGGQPFSLVLDNPANYDAAYRFYVEVMGYTLEPIGLNSGGQLFVLCETAECDPIRNPGKEVASFGPAKVESIESIMGVRIFKLVDSAGGNQS